MRTTWIIIGLVFGLFLFFFLAVMFESNQPRPYSWYPNYSKRSDQPYGCSLIFKRMNDLFPEKSFKTLLENDPVFENYEQIVKNLNTDYYYEDDWDEAEEWDEEIEEYDEADSVYDNNEISLDQEITNDEIEYNDSVFMIDSTLINGLDQTPEYLLSFKDTLNASVIMVGEPNMSNDAIKALLAHAYFGNTIFIASTNFSFMEDFVSIPTTTYPEFSDSIQLISPITQKKSQFRKQTVHSYFNRLNKSIAKTIATNNKGFPILVEIPYGKGSLLLSSTPIAFTNYSMMRPNNLKFIEETMSYLPIEDCLWGNNYYGFNAGGKEESELDFIMKNPPLKWAFYLALLTMIVFMIFNLKRTQRLIPILNKPKNSTIEFVQIMAQLYLQQGSHTLIAKKKVLHFLDYLRRVYKMNTTELNNDFVASLSKRVNMEKNKVHFLITYINEIQQKSSVSQDELITLNRVIEKFKKETS